MTTPPDRDMQVCWYCDAVYAGRDIRNLGATAKPLETLTEFRSRILKEEEERTRS